MPSRSDPAAPGCSRGFAEQIADRAAKRLGAVDRPQPRALGIKLTIDQVGQQRTHHGRVLGTAFAKPQDVLLALGIDAQGDEHHPVAEVNPVDQNHRQVQPQASRSAGVLNPARVRAFGVARIADRAYQAQTILQLDAVRSAFGS